jgi:hypothetical protein
MIIWNKEPLMGFEMCLWEQSHVCMKSCSCLLSSQRCLQIPFALNAMTSSSLWNLATILYH